MPQKSGFFDTTADDPREYPSREFAEYFARFVGNGIFGGGEKLKVTATGKDMNVSINLGYGWINGYMYSVFDAPLVLPIQQATTQDRIDRIILRLDVSTPVRAIKALVLQGNPATTPQAPAIVRTGDIYDLSLAQVLVKANTSTIQPYQITDERLNTQVCGIVTGVIQQADTTTIFNQFQSWLNTKTAEYQKQWEDFLKGIQDQGFATTQYVDQQISDKAAAKQHKHDAGDINTGTMAAARLPAASTSAAGITQLSTATNGTRTNVAAAESAVKAAYDRAEQAFQSASDGKNQVAVAITGKGVPAAGSDTYPVLAQKIWQITTGSPVAKITMPASTGAAYFKEAGKPGGRNEYYVIVTGLGFRARYIIIQQWMGVYPPRFRSEYVADKGNLVYTNASEYTHFEAVQAEQLPSMDGPGDKYPTITSDGFIMPVGREDDYAGKEVFIVAIG